jgi:hypothetical protein
VRARPGTNNALQQQAEKRKGGGGAGKKGQLGKNKLNIDGLLRKREIAMNPGSREKLSPKPLPSSDGGGGCGGGGSGGGGGGSGGSDLFPEDGFEDDDPEFEPSDKATDALIAQFASQCTS